MKLTAKERAALPAKDFADPVHRAYPIQDPDHTLAAWARFQKEKHRYSPSHRKRVGGAIRRRLKHFRLHPHARVQNPGTEYVHGDPSYDAGTLIEITESCARLERDARMWSPAERRTRYQNLERNARTHGAKLTRKRNPRAPAATEKSEEYRKLHWGKPAEASQRALTVATPTGLVALGELIEVTYRTKKGSDRELTDYVHKFSRPRPLLCKAKDGRLVIAGGSYKVITDGIAG